MTPPTSERSIVTIEELLEELNHATPWRREEALKALAVCKQLVDVRAAANRTSALVEWHTVTDSVRLERDRESKDPALRAAADDAFDELNHILALRATDRESTPAEARIAKTVKADIDRMIEEFERQKGPQRN